MQAIDVLGDQGEMRKAFLPPGQDPVSGVGLNLGHQTPPPVVPLPDEGRVPLEGLRGGQVLGSKLSPQAVLAPERRDSRLG